MRSIKCTVTVIPVWCVAVPRNRVFRAARARAHYVVCGDGVEMEVRQRKREYEGLRREGEQARADLKVKILARPAVDLVGGERLQRHFGAGDHGSRVGEGDRTDQGGRANTPVFTASSPHTQWCHAASI